MNFDLATELWLTNVLPGNREFTNSTDTEVDYFSDIESLVDILPRVLLFNDDHHTFDEVIVQVMRATGCSEARAEGIAWEVHSRGQALVYEGELFECLRVSSVLEEIALHTQVLT
jgi:ATP-dependent Clp protease adaptor protein ClpS